MQVTDAQRDSRKVWTYLERLFDWSGTRSKPMPPSDLATIREQVTEGFERLVNRADSLERAPLLREVVEGDDGTKTVVIDMRDGSTRRFQTRVDWFDKSETMADPLSPELIDLRESYDAQSLLLEEEVRKATVLSQRVLELETLLSAAEVGLAEANESATVALEDLSDQTLLAQEAANMHAAALLNIKSLEKALDLAEVEASKLREELWEERESSQGREEENVLAQEVASTQKERIGELELLLAESEKSLAGVNDELSDVRRNYAEQVTLTEEVELALEGQAAKLERLLSTQGKWEERYSTASKVIEESLPAIAELLAEKTAENENLRAELEELQ